MEKESKEPELRVRNTKAFKLKDKLRRNFVVLKLNETFGFTPQTIVIEKIQGMNNTFVVRALLTEEEIEKEEKLKSEMLVPAKNQ